MNIKDYYASSDEKPLERMPADGGFTGIFRTICCIGDSMSSGEFESIDDNSNKNITICSNTHGDSIWDALLVQRFLISLVVA